MIFKSKVDRWLATVIWGAVAACALPFFLEDDVRSLVVTFVMGVLVFYLWGNTKYIVTEDTLIVKGGLFTKRISIDRIYKVTKTNNPLSAPALSMDRLEILYSPNMQMVLISPKDREAFVALLLEINNTIRVDEELFT